jgi:hypothetical protein
MGVSPASTAPIENILMYSAQITVWSGQIETVRIIDSKIVLRTITKSTPF